MCGLTLQNAESSPKFIFKFTTKIGAAMASDFEVTNEIRFAVVMYGGVSLAIYMNGIAQELLHLVRSTARKGWEDDDVCQFRFDEKHLTGTEKVYRRLADKLTPGTNTNGVRFIVDILSGTSAGGINGIFLAKALAKGQSMDELENLWVKEGDLAKLLNDGGSTKGTNLPKPSKQQSLLNSDRMYCKLLEAFTGMDLPDVDPAGNRKRPNAPSPPHPELVEELDLYVTTTDIRGRVIPLRTADRLVYERNYKWAFHFKYRRPELDPSAPQNGQKKPGDFDLEQNPFLSFAARCTSSFPFAFEPMCLNKVEELVPSYTGYPYKVDFDMWRGFFSNSHLEGTESAELKARSFGDGGYLDNKPFGYVTDTLLKRSSTVPSRRVLLYIEPAPEHPELQTSQQRKAELTAPNALQNSLDALVTLPGYQPIREDLLRINERNRTIRKVTELINGISLGLARPVTDEPVTDENAEGPGGAPKKHVRAVAALDQHRSTPIADLQVEYGSAYASYLLLRAYDLTDILANVIGRALKYDQEGSYFFAIRCIVRAWRSMFYERAEQIPAKDRTQMSRDIPEDDFGTTIAAFLLDFDLSYHIRKERFVSSQIDFLYTLDSRAMQRLRAMGLTPPDSFKLRDDPGAASFRAELRRLKKPIDDNFKLLRSAHRHLHDNIELADELAELRTALLEEVLDLDHIEKAQHDVVPPGMNDKSEEGTEKKEKPKQSPLNAVLGVIRPEDKQRGVFAPSLQFDHDDQYVENARQVIKDPGLVAKLNRIAEIIRKAVAAAVKKITDEEKPKEPTADDAALLAYEAVRILTNQFPDYDSALFPVVYGTDVGELDPVDIVRVSPEDAPTIVDELKHQVHKLKGIWLGHFGAFLDTRWRRSDILWGRLDAAERLIQSLLPGDEAIPFIKDAHDSILQEFVKGCEVDVAQQLADAAFSYVGDIRSRVSKEKDGAPAKDKDNDKEDSDEVNSHAGN
jgi:patatin-related protein